jgi:3-hydroxyanthranilate 3,4-dioxygenase
MSLEFPRRRSLNIVTDAQEYCPYDEIPLIPDKIDFQLCASRSAIPQPFFFCGTHDMLLAVLGGEGEVEFRHSSVLKSRVVLGDYLYVPARTPHRIVPDGELLTLRYKARSSGAEAAIWYCDRCGNELYRHEYDSDTQVPQLEWVIACDAYTSDVGLRTCTECKSVHDPVDLTQIRWSQVGDALEAEKRSAESKVET